MRNLSDFGETLEFEHSGTDTTGYVTIELWGGMSIRYTVEWDGIEVEPAEIGDRGPHGEPESPSYAAAYVCHGGKITGAEILGAAENQEIDVSKFSDDHKKSIITYCEEEIESRDVNESDLED